MGKTTTYILIMSGLMLLFYFSGLLDGTISSRLLNIILTPESFGNTSGTLYLEVMGVLLGIAAGTGIVIGILTKNVELAIVSPLAVWLLSLFFDFIRVFLKVFAENPVIAVLLFSPIMLLWFITIVDWWRGRDI